MTIVNVASRYKEAEPLVSKDSNGIANALPRIYRSPLRWHKTLQVDPGREFMGRVKELFSKHEVKIRVDNVNIHSDQGVVERFRILIEGLFGHQYAEEMNFRLTKDQ